MADYVAGKGTTALSIIGTVLGGIATLAEGGSLVGNGNGNCSENTPVNRFELEQAEKMANKDMEIAYWRGQDETNRKISDAYSKLESRINGVAAEVRANKDEQAGINLQQAVYNGTNTAALGCLQNQVNQLLGMTKMVIPNGSVCPGWGEVKVSVVSADTAAA